MFVFLGGFILICVGVILVIKHRRYLKKRISLRYQNDKGNFEVEGFKDNFIIKKDENFEFLVEDGKIVACKDKRKSLNFVYYKEDI